MTEKLHIPGDKLTPYAIDQLLDPLAARSEAEGAKQPQRIAIPPFTWSDSVLKEIERYETAWSNWSEADSRHAEALEDYRAAQLDDEKALRDAAKKGATTAPAATKREAAARHLEFCRIAAEVARKECTGIAQGPLTSLMRANVAGCFWEAFEYVEKVEAASLALLASIRSNLAQLDSERARASEMVRWVAINKGNRPDMSNSSRLRNVNLPNDYDAKMQWARDTLEMSR